MSCYFYQNKTDSILWLMYPCVLYKQTTMQSTQWHMCGEKALSYIFGGQANVVQPIWGGADEGSNFKTIQQKFKCTYPFIQQ